MPLTKFPIKSAVAASAVVMAWVLFAPPLADLRRMVAGQEGRYGEIKTMEAAFDRQAYDRLPRHFECFRHDYPDGSWIQVLSSDSHHTSGGGTTGVLESNGRRHFYFGHVCGKGEGIAIRLGKTHFDPLQTSEPGLLKVK
jgi:hypothetical protein